MLSKLLLTTLLVFSFAIRIIAIDQYPPSLNWDEVSHGYNAYSLLKTGVDEWGEPYPTIFRAYGDYKLPIYIYLTVPSVAVFGLTPLGVRLPSVIAGTLIVLFTYLLVNLLSKNKKVAFIAAILVAIEPWSFFLSRVALEANVSLALLLAGIYFFLQSIYKKTNTLIVSSILISASMWTYNTTRIFAPILVIALVLMYQKEILKLFVKKKAEFSLAIIIFLFFVSTVFLQLLSTEGSARYQNVAILDDAAIGKIEFYRNTSDLPDLADKLIYNRYSYFSYNFINNYVSHFSVDFLFNSGGSNYQFNIQDHGLLFAVSFPILTIGVISGVLDKKTRKLSNFMIIWALLAPIVPSITKDAPHTLRSIVIIPVPMVFTALGIYFLYKVYSNQKKYFLIFISLIYIFSFSSYLITYATDYREKYSWAWQQGYQEAVNYALDNYDNYDTIIFTKKYGEPHEFVLFYSAWDPKKYRNDPNLIRFYQSDWYWVDRFDKFNFINEWDIPAETSDDWILESGEQVDTSGNVLLITSPGVYPKGWTIDKEIYFLNGEKAFEILRK